MQNRRLIIIVLTVAGLLMVPLTAMQFTDEVNWDETDFIIAGALLLGAGLLYELGARMTGNRAYRTAVGLAVAAGLILIWMNLAVGLIGNENNPANLLYGGVLAIGALGAMLVRFEARGMMRVLIVTAIAQALVPVVALVIWKPDVSTTDLQMKVVGVFILNGFFVLLFLASAWQFHRASLNGIEGEPPLPA